MIIEDWVGIEMFRDKPLEDYVKLCGDPEDAGYFIPCKLAEYLLEKKPAST